MKFTLQLACAAALLLPAAHSVRAAGPASAGPDDPAAVVRMNVEEFKAAFDKQQVISVDVRGLDAYRAGHIPGAVLMASGADAAKADELKKAGKQVVTYCA